MITATTAQPPLPRREVRDEEFFRSVIRRRFAAWLLDLLFIGLILAVLFLVVTVLGVITFGLGFALMAALSAVPFLYHLLSLTRQRSATPGQSIMGLTVRRDDDLGPPVFAQAFVFTLLFYVTMAASGLLFLVMLFTTRNRALHDMASGLVVVRRRALDAWNAR